MADDLQNDASKKLAAYVERLEKLNAEKEGIGADINDVLKEVGNDGFDKNVVKMILKRRKLGKGACDVMDDLVATYEAAIKRQGDMLDNITGRVPIGRGAGAALNAEKSADELLDEALEAGKKASEAFDKAAGPRKPTGGATAASDKARAAGFDVADLTPKGKIN